MEVNGLSTHSKKHGVCLIILFEITANKTAAIAAEEQINKECLVNVPIKQTFSLIINSNLKWQEIHNLYQHLFCLSV